MNDHQKSIHIIEQDMARSRAEIERTAEALRAKMEPENLADAARQVILESTNRVEERVRELAEQASTQVESLGETAVDYIHQNPFPALLAGLGIGLLISLAERDVFALHTSQTAAAERPPAGRLKQTISSNPRLLQAQRQTTMKVRRVNRQHPLLLGAAVLGMGMLLGSLLPATQREDELLGPTRDRLLESGKETAQHAIDKAKMIVDHELDKRKAEASELKDSVEESALRAFNETSETRHDVVAGAADIVS